jgi:hypothetical protein
MGLLPQSTHLGALAIVEVYEYYDIPCLFACKNAMGYIYLAVWIDSEEEVDTWLYVPMSLAKFKSVRSGEIELRDVFLNAEDSFVFQVQILRDSSLADEVRAIPCENLTDEQLPMAGEYLNHGNEPCSILEKQDVAQIAVQKNREILDLAFEFPNRNPMEAPASNLGMLLKSFQNLIDAIGQANDGSPTTQGKIPSKITDRTELTIIGTFAGSFGIELASSPSSQINMNLFEDSLVRDAIEKFLELVKLSNDSEDNKEALRKQLFELKSRAASGYSEFLENLLSAKAKLRINWGSTKLEKGGSAELPLASARAALRIAQETSEENEKQYQVSAKLIGGNVRTKQFEILDLRANKTYSGRILDEALSATNKATLNELYVATIREVIERSPITAEGKVKYKLAALRRLSAEESSNRGETTQIDSPQLEITDSDLS